jgi:hypothetical protein
MSLLLVGWPIAVRAGRLDCRTDARRGATGFPPVSVGGMSSDLFAGISVSDFQASLRWYETFFGGPPAFFPNDVEAVWAVGEHQ